SRRIPFVAPTVTHTPRTPAVLLALVLGAGLLAGCSSEDDGDPSGSAPASTGSTASSAPEESAAPVPTKHLVGQVVGRLPGPRRDRLVRRVAPVVDGWLDAAFTGTFPR